MFKQKTLSGLAAVLFLTMTIISNAHATVACDWAGLYLGSFAGGSTGARITSSEPLRLDNNANWFRPFNSSFRFKTRASFIGGLTAGYNLPLGTTPFLAGFEAEYGYLNLRGTSTDPNQFPYAALPNQNLQNASQNVVTMGKSFGYALLAARISYATCDYLLFYIKSGAFFSRIQSKFNSVKTEDLAPVYLALLGSKKIVGYGIGGGIEYALPCERFSNVSLKAEYLYLGINKRQKVYGHCSCNFLWRMIEQIHGVNTLKVGINYQFK